MSASLWDRWAIPRSGTCTSGPAASSDRNCPGSRAPSRTGVSENNQTIRAALQKAAGSALHVMGLVSPGGVHSHEDQIAAMMDLAEEAGVTVHLHAFLDGRDTPPKSAAASLARFDGRVASLCGRYYAMDRDGRWDPRASRLRHADGRRGEIPVRLRRFGAGSGLRTGRNRRICPTHSRLPAGRNARHRSATAMSSCS